MSGPDGKKQILLSTFHQHIEILGHDGYKPSGWPLSFEDSTFQGSPMLYDIDGDGTNDVGVVDKNGNLFWIRIGEYGQYLEDYHIQVPKLKIKRDWASGLDPKFSDNYVAMSMFDHNSDRGSRRYSNENNAEQPLFSKNKNDAERSIISAKIKADDLGPIRQDSYPELNKKIDTNTNTDIDSNREDSNRNSETVSRSRRLLSVSDESVSEKREEKQEVRLVQPSNTGTENKETRNDIAISRDVPAVPAVAPNSEAAPVVAVAAAVVPPPVVAVVPPAAAVAAVAQAVVPPPVVAVVPPAVAAAVVPPPVVAAVPPVAAVAIAQAVVPPPVVAVVPPAVAVAKAVVPPPIVAAVPPVVAQAVPTDADILDEVPESSRGSVKEEFLRRYGEAADDYVPG